MNKATVFASLAALLSATPTLAQDTEKSEYPSPNAIVDAAPASDWVKIAPSDLLVMDLAPDAEGNARRVVIQLMPEPFTQGWIRNIRKLAAAHWWDGTSINRVQDNYVVQWGDAGYDNPESGETEQKALPEGLEAVPESDYYTAATSLDWPILV
ncbi:peptidylprolyl isomerase, partial [Parasphingorhabdus sp.]|uniref:peptidylprolyl isomerase n=1 Tax=Parasphingorhabdus sp. TaxID=2709688 RepID=UPI003C740A29